MNNSIAYFCGFGALQMSNAQIVHMRTEADFGNSQAKRREEVDSPNLIGCVIRCSI